MEDKHYNSLSKSLGEDLGKDTTSLSEIKRFYDFLLTGSYTMSMVTEATKIPQKNLTRYKAMLEKEKQIWVTEIKKCKVTRRKAMYLTANPDLKYLQNCVQINLFD